MGQGKSKASDPKKKNESDSENEVEPITDAVLEKIDAAADFLTHSEMGEKIEECIEFMDKA